MFEVGGLGGCLLTDKMDDNSDFYEADYEIVEYESEEECAEKAKWLLSNPKQCKAIGEAAHKRGYKNTPTAVELKK